MKDVYTTFLQTTDLASWEACLQHYRDLLNGGGGRKGSPLPRLAEGLCIAQYTLWLASLCGEEQTAKTARHSFDQFTAAAMTQDLIVSADGARIRAIIAAGRGYTAIARAILEETRVDLPLEMTLIILPTPPAKQAQVLRERVGIEPGQHPFLPAIHFCAHALLDLGYFDQVREMLCKVGPARGIPLLIDLHGKLAELSGAWSKAADLYQSSDWLTHRYRASICSAILRASAGLGADQRWLEADDKVLRGMLLGGAETDQTEVMRTAYFVNACRWYNFDNWLVQYELGVLSFRRRRHVEAEEYLKLSAKQAPEAARFAINDLRFVNLTWISDASIDTKPETFECAHAALVAPAAEDKKARIRTYLARATGELSLLAPVNSENSPYDRGEANEIRGRMPEALQCWSEALGEAYTPRALHRLIRSFVACGFAQTAVHLVDIAMQEAQDNFFDLWELGGVLLSIRQGKDKGFAWYQDLEEPLSKVATRLEQLAEFEFQHLMRAWNFYNSYNRGDLAARVLRRADRLAESAEEHLTLAIASQDTMGQSHLLRAEREASHRLMRIDIARWFANFGQVSRARQILKAAGVFDASTRLEPLEYVIALQCKSPCLTEEERQGLLIRAAKQLDQDLRAGLYARYANLFIKRLNECGMEISRELRERFSTTDDAEEAAETLWQSWASTLESLDDRTLLEEERRSMEIRAAAYGQDKTVLCHHLSVWENLHRRIGTIQQAIKSMRPDREPSETPISRAIARNERGARVSRLWRAYLGATVPDHAVILRAQIQEFYRDEEQLEDEWEAQRRRDMQRDLQKAQSYVDWGTDVLAKIEHAVRRGGLWPPFLNIETPMLNDIETLRMALTRDLSMAGLGF
jgi:hypothetical protein